MRQRRRAVVDRDAGIGGSEQHPTLTARVLAEIQSGYVSLERARTDYGVAIDPECMLVLEDETAALRARLRDGADADG